MKRRKLVRRYRSSLSRGERRALAYVGEETAGRLLEFRRRHFSNDGDPRSQYYDLGPKFYLGGAPQRSYLLPRVLQDQIFLDSGYQPGRYHDYGLVSKAVGDRDLPVWQTAPDAANREDLVPIGNVYNNWYPRVGKLYHAGRYPTAIYYNNNNGKFYQKAWDLNDYHGTSEKKGSIIEPILTNIMDEFGSPVVVTTGYQEIVPDSDDFVELENIFNNFLKKKGLRYSYYDDFGKHIIHLPEITVTPTGSFKTEDRDDLILN